jgi:hypothetical protein
MAHPEVEEWLNTADGVPMDPDGAYGNQCVDLVDAYGAAIFGVPWNVCVGGVVGAKQLLDAAPDKYWIRLDNNPADPNLLPPRGAVVVTSGDDLNQWGHTYVVLSADVNGADAMQQDGFAEPRQFVNGGWYSAKPAHKARLPWEARGMGYTLGWLIPRDQLIVDTGAAGRLGLPPTPPALLGYQRITVPDSSVGYRKAPDAGAELLRWLDPDTTYDFKGYVVRNGDVWLIGRYSDGFAKATGFLDEGTHDLPDLTATLFPEPAKANNIRVTGPDGVNRRKGPDKNAELINSFPPGVDITIGGYVIDSDPYGQGNRIWFVGGISGGYMHSSGFTDQSVEGLPQLEAPADVSPVVPKPVYDFVSDLGWTEKIPANLTNLELDRGPAQDKPTIVHQMGTPGVDTLGSTINTFIKAGEFKSSHFAVSKGRAVQMVALKDRAYHAGTVGNGYVGIETDPYQDAETIATVRRILADLQALGYSAALIRHKDVPGAATSCGTLIDLAKYRLDEPVVVIPPVEPPASDGDSAEEFFEWLKREFKDRDR